MISGGTNGNKSSTTYGGTSVINTASAFDKVMDVLSGNSLVNAHILYSRVGKLIKYEKKLIKQKQQLVKDISTWSSVVPSEDSQKMLNEFNKCLATSRDIEEEILNKYENLRLQITNVEKREKKSNELKVKRNKMLKQLREQESKVGQTSTTTLTKESLEELEVSVDVVEEQYIRAIDNSLKGALVDYLLTLQSTSSKLKDSSNNFFDYLNSSPGNLKRYSAVGGGSPTKIDRFTSPGPVLRSPNGANQISDNSYINMIRSSPSSPRLNDYNESNSYFSPTKLKLTRKQSHTNTNRNSQIFRDQEKRQASQSIDSQSQEEIDRKLSSRKQEPICLSCNSPNKTQGLSSKSRSLTCNHKIDSDKASSTTNDWNPQKLNIPTTYNADNNESKDLDATTNNNANLRTYSTPGGLSAFNLRIPSDHQWG